MLCDKGIVFIGFLPFLAAFVVGGKMNAFRLVSCPECGHKLRYGVSNCTLCWRPTPLLNRWIFLLITAAPVALLSWTVLQGFFS